MKNLRKLTASEIENTPFELNSAITAAGMTMGTTANNSVIDNMEANSYGTLPRASWGEPMYPWDKEGMMKTRDRNGCYKNY